MILSCMRPHITNDDCKPTKQSRNVTSVRDDVDDDDDDDEDDDDGKSTLLLFGSVSGSSGSFDDEEPSGERVSRGLTFPNV